MATGQFDSVNCRYGAPMGRVDYGTPADAESKISLFKVRMCQGYDDGGAYWGYPEDLYCARDKDDKYRAFARAPSRLAAADALEIPNSKLSVPFRARESEEVAHAS